MGWLQRQSALIGEGPTQHVGRAFPDNGWCEKDFGDQANLSCTAGDHAHLLGEGRPPCHFAPAKGEQSSLPPTVLAPVGAGWGRDVRECDVLGA